MSTQAAKRAASWLARALAKSYPEPRCALAHRNPFELLVATILSAQCTDRQVNRITPALFARFANAAGLAEADPAEVEQLVRTTGFFRSKTRSIIGAARALAERHGGQVPRTMAELVLLPGVARKTANVVSQVAYGEVHGVVVDTHVGRLARRLGLSGHEDPVKLERDLMALFPKSAWAALSLRLIEHGRQVCLAARPRCPACPLSARCPTARDAA